MSTLHSDGGVRTTTDFHNQDAPYKKCKATAGINIMSVYQQTTVTEGQFFKTLYPQVYVQSWTYIFGKNEKLSINSCFQLSRKTSFFDAKCKLDKNWIFFKSLGTGLLRHAKFIEFEKLPKN